MPTYHVVRPKYYAGTPMYYMEKLVRHAGAPHDDTGVRNRRAAPAGCLAGKTA